MAPRDIGDMVALLGCAFLWWPNLALRVSTRLWKADFSHVYDVLERWDPLGLADAEAGQVAYQPFVAQILDGLERGADVQALAGMLSNVRFGFEWHRAWGWRHPRSRRRRSACQARREPFVDIGAQSCRSGQCTALRASEKPSFSM